MGTARDSWRDSWPTRVVRGGREAADYGDERGLWGRVNASGRHKHTAASLAIADGDVEEVSWQLGHKNSVVTRAVYRHEVKDAERRARRRAKMEARYGPILEAAQPVESEPNENGVVVALRSASA